MQSLPQQPFSNLGARLRYFRETRQESVAEVCGAVEIEPEMLERIERGEECPSEDVLTLLINHFSLREQDAVQLWESAGFMRGSDIREAVQDLAGRAAVVIIAIDSRTQYVSGASIQADHNGVVLGFTQTGPHGQPLPVARVGMSYEHAAQVMRALEQALLRKRYLPTNQLLPPGEIGPSEQAA